MKIFSECASGFPSLLFPKGKFCEVVSKTVDNVTLRSKSDQMVPKIIDRLRNHQLCHNFSNKELPSHSCHHSALVTYRTMVSPHQKLFRLTAARRRKCLIALNFLFPASFLNCANKEYNASRSCNGKHLL